MNKKEGIPRTVTGGLETVAVRLPDNEIARNLINLSGCPIAAPSANLSGRPSPTAYQHVVSDLNGKVDIILKGENCRVGIESTVLDMTSDEPVVLRPGIITPEQIEAAIGKKVSIDPAIKFDFKKIEAIKNGTAEETIVAKAPGMKYKHYAPKAQMFVVEGERNRVRQEIERLKTLNEKMGSDVGVILLFWADWQGRILPWRSWVFSWRILRAGRVTWRLSQ